MVLARASMVLGVRGPAPSSAVAAGCVCAHPGGLSYAPWPQASAALLGEGVTRRVQITRKFTQLRDEIVNTGDAAPTRGGGVEDEALACDAQPDEERATPAPVVRGGEILF